MSQEAIIEALKEPAAYDEEVEHIRLLQTHISYIFLTGRYAYKIKKPVNFGFLDFTTLEKRKFYCEEELHCKDEGASPRSLDVGATEERQG